MLQKRLAAYLRVCNQSCILFSFMIYYLPQKMQVDYLLNLGDDKNARIAIVFSACRLPPKTEIDHQKLFR